MRAEDTIVATATAAGVGALSIVRISGPNSRTIIGGLIAGELAPARVAGLRTLRTEGGELLDEAVVIQYRGPHSYTGEDAVEIICHGGWATATRITRAAVDAGARPALPGEFTRRAVLNGKLDLLQAEAVNDLIRAESTASASLALRQLDGGLSKRIQQLREDILGVEALVAYEIDFPEEDDGPVDGRQIITATNAVLDSIDDLVDTTPVGELVRQGATVAIVGAPNVGKSSLFNALLGRKRALVTDIPGTTRDALEAVLDVVPVPLRLVDTAGLRESTDEVERLGVAISREYLEKATAILVCGDSGETLEEALAHAQAVAAGLVIPVQTKRDLEGREVPEAFGVSAFTGEGLDALVAHVSSLVSRNVGLPDPDSPVVTHARYRHVLTEARGELVAFRDARKDGAIPATVSAVHLRESVRLLEEMIGTLDVDEVLGRVFSSFCVGK